MQKINLLFLAALLAAAASAFAQSTEITTSDYRDFLNEAASSAPQAVQEIGDGSWKIVDDSGSASILRSGAVGSYRYEVISGKENVPMTFLSYHDASRYCEWKNFATSISTFNFNCCVSSCDPDLKSNILTFCITNSGSPPNQASGVAAVADAELGEILEEAIGIIAVGAVGVEGARGPEIEPVEGINRGVVDERNNLDVRNQELSLRLAQQKNLTSLLQLSQLQLPQALDAALVEDREQQGMAHFFYNAAVRNSQAMPFYYGAADTLLLQAQGAWNKRAESKQIYDVKKENLKRATTQLQKEETALANKDLEKTLLGRFAMATGIVAKSASAVPEPHSQIVSVVAKVFSVGADSVNKRRENFAFAQAQRKVEIATEEESKSSQKAQEAEEKAFEKDAELQDAEKIARSNEVAATRALAESLKPPLLSTKEGDWNAWAEKIVAACNLDFAWVSRIASKGKTNPAWAANKAAAAWNERINQTKRDIENDENKKITTLQPLEKNYQEAQNKAEIARETAYKAQERRDGMIQAEAYAEEEYSAMKALLYELEHHSAKTNEIRKALEVAKSETALAFAAFKKAKKEREANEEANQELIFITETKAQAAEEKAMRCFQKQHASEKKYLRDIERAKAHLAADQAAWLAVWPEEVLHLKIQNQVGEIAFANAEKAKSEEAWMNASREAYEIERLWNVIAQASAQELSKASEENRELFLIKRKNAEIQKAAWGEKAAIAKGKATFAKIKNLWNSFAEATQNFIKNRHFESDHFESDFNNAALVATASEATAEAAEEAGKSASLFSFPDADKITASIARAVRHVKNLVDTIQGISSPGKRMNTMTWYELVQKEVSQSKKLFAENANTAWKAEFIWVAEATQSAADFIKSISEKHSHFFYEIKQSDPSSLVAPTIINNYYPTQIRYIKARRNLAGRTLESQKKILASERKAYFKKEKNWKSDNGLFQARKKIAAEWKSKKQELPKKTSAQHVLESSIVLETAQKEEFEHDAPIDIFEDLPAQEKKLGEERLVLDQENTTLLQKTEELTKREEALIRDGELLDKKTDLLREQENRAFEEKQKFAEEKAAFEKSTQEIQNQKREALEKKEKELQAHEISLAQERETLAKKAESLEALAMIKSAPNAWVLMETALEEEAAAATCAEMAPAEASWIKARDAAENLEKLWEEIIASNEQASSTLTSSSEKARLARETKNACYEKAIWKKKAAAWGDQIKNAQEMSNKAALQGADQIWNEIKKNSKESKAMSKAAHSAAQAAPPWERVVVLWNDTLALAASVHGAFDELIILYQQNIENAPERFKKKWTIDLKSANSERSLWVEQTNMWMSNRESAAAHFEEEKKEAEALEAKRQAEEQAIAQKAAEDRIAQEIATQAQIAALKQSALESEVKTTAVYDAGKKDEGDRWQQPSKIFDCTEEQYAYYKSAARQAAEAYQKAQRESARRSDRVVLYTQLAIAYEAARVALEEKALGKKNKEADASWEDFLRRISYCRRRELENAAKDVAGCWKRYLERKKNKEQKLSQEWLGAGVLEKDKGNHLEGATKVADKPDLVTKWCDVAVLQHQSLKSFAKATEAYAAEKKEEGDNLYNAGDNFIIAADNLQEAIYAEAANKPELAQRWKCSSELHNMAADAYTAQKSNEGVSWNNAALSVTAAAKNLDAAEKNLEKAISAERAEKLDVARQCHEAIQLQHQSAGFYARAALAYVVGSTDEGNSWFAAANSSLVKPAAQAVVQQLYFKEGKIRWMLEQWRKRKATKLQSQSVDFYIKAAVAHAEEKRDEGNSWNGVGRSLIQAAETLGEAIKAEQAAELDLAWQWREVVQLHQCSADSYNKAAVAYMAGQKEEGDRWYNAAQDLSNAIEKLSNAIEVNRANASDEVRCRYGVVAARKAQAEALRNKNEEEIAKQNAIAEVWEQAAEAYKKLEREVLAGSDQAIFYRESVMAYEAVLAALVAKEFGKTNKEKIIFAYEGERWNAQKAQEADDAEKQQEHLSCATAYQCWLNALLKDLPGEETKQKMIQEALEHDQALREKAERVTALQPRMRKEKKVAPGNIQPELKTLVAASWRNFLGRINDYKKRQQERAERSLARLAAVEEFKKFKQKKKQELLAQESAQAIALAQKNDLPIDLQEKIADIQKRAEWAHEDAVEQQEVGNFQAAEAWREGAEALQKQVAALIQRDDEAAELHKNIAGIQWLIAKTYERAAQEQENSQSVEFYFKSAQARKEQITALIKKDKRAATMHLKIAGAQWNLAELNLAEALAEQINDLSQGDKKTEE